MRKLLAVLTIAALACAASADVLPGNLLHNPDVEAEGDAGWPAAWFHGAMTDWNTDQYVSPTHSLHIDDTSTNLGADWRSEGVLIPGGLDTLHLKWHWLYQDISGELAVTIRFFDTVDANGNASGNFHGEINYWSGQGSNPGWEAREEFAPIPADAGSFDIMIRTLSGNGVGGTGATGQVWVDDISVAPEPGSLALLGLLALTTLRRRR